MLTREILCSAGAINRSVENALLRLPRTMSRWRLRTQNGPDAGIPQVEAAPLPTLPALGEVRAAVQVIAPKAGR